MHQYVMYFKKVRIFGILKSIIYFCDEEKREASVGLPLKNSFRNQKLNYRNIHMSVYLCKSKLIMFVIPGHKYQIMNVNTSNSRLSAASKRHLNFVSYLREKGWQFHNDVVRNCIMWRTEDHDYREFQEKKALNIIRSEFGQMSKEYLVDTIGSDDIAPEFNPIKYWLRNLKYDGQNDYIHKLCSYIVLDNDYEEERARLYTSLKKWFVGAIKTLFDPFYVHKHVIVLQGPSGIGKTPFLESILPNELFEFKNYITAMDLTSKDATMELTSSFMINIDEIDDFFKSSNNRNAFKSYFTRKIVKVRPPFGRKAVVRPRIAAFIGSCNESTFLNDPTGTQRFTIFLVRKLQNRRYSSDGEFVEDFPMARVWGQAYALYKEGYNPEYSHDELVVNERANEVSKYNTPEFETIINFIKPANKQDDTAKFMTATELCSYINSQQTDVNFTNVRLGKALVRLQYKRLPKKINGHVIYGYYVRFLHEEDAQWGSVITPKTLNKFSKINFKK